MPTIEVVTPDRRRQESTYLLDSKMDVYSQYGEDGIIEKIFEIIRPAGKWCVEFGAWDGIHLSNTCRLVKDQDWNCVQIEGDPAKFARLEENFRDNDRSHRINTIIGYTPGVDTIDDALATTPIPPDFDLLSIDIDGNDWHIWKSVERYRPRLVVIEFNSSIPNDVVFIQDRDMEINEGCSLAALIRLGKDKGYELVCVNNMNGFFVRKDEFPKFGIAHNDIDSMRLDPTGRIFYTFSGKIYHTIRRFSWRLRKVEPAPDMLQILSPSEIGYGDRIKKR